MRSCAAMVGFALLLAAGAPGEAAQSKAGQAEAAKPVTHLVGPNRALRKPSDAAARVRDGDTVEIEAGDYVDCAVWRANRLTIRARGGEVHVRDKSCAGKGIWILQGDQITIEGIRFSGAAVPDRNGAGIRAHGGSFTVRNSVFERNENGILTNAGANARIVIEGSTFVGNGKCEPHCAHGIYIGEVASLEVRGSTFRGQKVGHHIKSRAKKTTVIGNRIEDGADGTASYLIDVPWGGEVLITGNLLHKGPLSENRGTAIAIGAEGARHPTPSIRVEDNNFRSDLVAPEPVAFIRNRTETPARLKGNRLCGAVAPLIGPGEAQATKWCD
jgi:hypothetical protein